ncbi:hypothetical protein FPV67DRAFT_1441185 [Lyophyllum atratum]|nr:hypothetical protein FPV67DRAFT_1441185 [Lyophyllum atratum]
MSLHDVSALLLNQPSLSGTNFLDCLQFIRLCRVAKGSLELHTPTLGSPPITLPGNILKILSLCLSLEESVVQAFWDALKTVVWAHIEVVLSEVEIQLYNKHALALLTFGDMLTLVELVTHKASLFTLKEGALPVYTTSLYCRGCFRRYYHNYSVHKQTSTRTYYEGVPDCVQVAQHFFIESPVLELFANGMTFGWLSATNCARIYNRTLGLHLSHVVNNILAFKVDYHERIRHSIHWQTSYNLRPEDVMNGFFLYSLLLDKSEHGQSLVLPHDEASQKDRLKSALHERNKGMEGVGQECYNHACDQCFIVFLDDQGHVVKMQPAVCDGNTIGHPSCRVHDCKIPLSTNFHRFCPAHEYLNGKCAVTACTYEQAPGFRTCSIPEHRSLEENYFRRGNAIFQLRSRLKKAGVAVPSDSVSLDRDDNNDEEVVIEDSKEGPIDVADACDGKPEGGNQRIRAYFGRRRTHNEQLIIIRRGC